MKFRFNYLIFSIFIFSYSYLSPLAKDSKVLTKDNFVLIQNLTTNQDIVGYDINNNSYISTIVKNIISYEQEDSISILTEKESIVCCPEQLIYDCNSKNFVEAKNLNLNSLLLSADNKKYKCLKIQRNNDPVLFYSICLEKQPNTFFAPFLMHNYTLSYPLLIWAFDTIITYIRIYKACQVFADLEEGRNKVLQEAENFKNQYTCNGDPLKADYLSRSINLDKVIPPPSDIPLLAGIQPNKVSYVSIIICPHLHGPICSTAKIQDDGDIKSCLYVYSLKDINFYNCSCSWAQIGSAILDRDNPVVKYYIKDEDDKILKQICDFVIRIPKYILDQLFKSNTNLVSETNYLIKKYPSCGNNLEKTFYGTRFGLHALYNMHKKKISPSMVKHIIKHGQCLPALRDDRLIYCHNNIVVVIEKNSKKVLNVGFYNKDLTQLNEKKDAKTVEDILKNAEPEDLTTQTKKYKKPGNYDDAVKDFESLNPSNVKTITNGKNEGKYGILPDGRDVIVRLRSQDGRPTLEIQYPNSNKKIKIRYGNKNK